VSGFVYFITPEAALVRSEETQLVKIGFTKKDPRTRLATLQCGSPLHLVLWAYVEGSEALERAFHEAFSELRSHGEWFLLQDKLYGFLSYLGDEPNIGNLIGRERVCVALFDNVSNPCPTFIPDDEYLWSISGDIRPLTPFYPEVIEA